MCFANRVTIFLVVVLFSTVAVVGISVVDPPQAEAAGGGEVNRCGGGKVRLSADEKETFVRHNRIRKNHNLKPFCVHPDLQRAARAHSKDMILRDYFSHDTKGRNESSCERVRRYGYRWFTCGENIAWGTGSKGDPAQIMRAWMNSSGHRHNILNRDFREIGVGAYTGTFQGYESATMYTADFGARRR